MARMHLFQHPKAQQVVKTRLNVQVHVSKGGNAYICKLEKKKKEKQPPWLQPTSASGLMKSGSDVESVPKFSPLVPGRSLLSSDPNPLHL